MIRLDGRQHTTTRERAAVQIKSLLANTPVDREQRARIIGDWLQTEERYLANTAGAWRCIGRDEAWRTAVNIAKLPELLRR